MSEVTILSKQPAGGRCSLYMRYAETLRDRIGLGVEVSYEDHASGARAPAILIHGIPVEPADGAIVSPEDIADSLRARLGDAAATVLCEQLEKTQEIWMAEWVGGG